MQGLSEDSAPGLLESLALYTTSGVGSGDESGLPGTPHCVVHAVAFAGGPCIAHDLFLLLCLCTDGPSEPCNTAAAAWYCGISNCKPCISAHSAGRFGVLGAWLRLLRLTPAVTLTVEVASTEFER